MDEFLESHIPSRNLFQFLTLRDLKQARLVCKNLAREGAKALVQRGWVIGSCAKDCLEGSLPFENYNMTHRDFNGLDPTLRGRFLSRVRKFIETGSPDPVSCSDPVVMLDFLSGAKGLISLSINTIWYSVGLEGSKLIRDRLNHLGDKLRFLELPYVVLHNAVPSLTRFPKDLEGLKLCSTCPIKDMSALPPKLWKLDLNWTPSLGPFPSSIKCLTLGGDIYLDRMNPWPRDLVYLEFRNVRILRQIPEALLPALPESLKSLWISSYQVFDVRLNLPPGLKILCYPLSGLLDNLPDTLWFLKTTMVNVTNLEVFPRDLECLVLTENSGIVLFGHKIVKCPRGLKFLGCRNIPCPSFEPDLEELFLYHNSHYFKLEDQACLLTRVHPELKRLYAPLTYWSLLNRLDLFPVLEFICFFYPSWWITWDTMSESWKTYGSSVPGIESPLETVMAMQEMLDSWSNRGALKKITLLYAEGLPLPETNIPLELERYKSVDCIFESFLQDTSSWYSRYTQRLPCSKRVMS